MIETSETHSKIPLKYLMQKTIERLLQIVDVPFGCTKIRLWCAWGADGSSGFKNPEQVSHLIELLVFFVKEYPLP